MNPLIHLITLTPTDFASYDTTNIWNKILPVLWICFIMLFMLVIALLLSIICNEWRIAYSMIFIWKLTYSCCVGLNGNEKSWRTMKTVGKNWKQLKTVENSWKKLKIRKFRKKSKKVETSWKKSNKSKKIETVEKSWKNRKNRKSRKNRDFFAYIIFFEKSDQLFFFVTSDDIEGKNSFLRKNVRIVYIAYTMLSNPFFIQPYSFLINHHHYHNFLFFAPVLHHHHHHSKLMEAWLFGKDPGVTRIQKK
jgi:hypothetical protein